jgi:5'-phosphate synthase pdxT subunit
MLRIGVLALQGGFIEHYNMLKTIDNINPILIKEDKDFEKINGLIIPGGESTTLIKMIKKYSLDKSIKGLSDKKIPIWGTCAGMILLGKNIKNSNQETLGIIDYETERNAFGSQLDSFITNKKIEKVSEKEIPLIFIRAPIISNLNPNIDILAEYDEKIIAVEKDNILATSFHPELSEDNTFHKYFVEKCNFEG